jgi:hypothetical protein
MSMHIAKGPEAVSGMTIHNAHAALTWRHRHSVEIDHLQLRVPAMPQRTGSAMDTVVRGRWAESEGGSAIAR